jgi:hypothetical protein
VREPTRALETTSKPKTPATAKKGCQFGSIGRVCCFCAEQSLLFQRLTIAYTYCMCPGQNAGKLCSFTCFSYHQFALPIHTFSSTFNLLRPWFYVKRPRTRNEHLGVLVLSRYQEPLTQNGVILDPLKIQKSNGFSSIVYVPNN